VQRGAFTLSAQALYFRASGERVNFAQVKVPAIDPVDGVGDMPHDFLLLPFSKTVHPGPVQNLADQPGAVSLIPLSSVRAHDSKTTE